MNETNIKYIGLSIKYDYYRFVTILDYKPKVYKICEPQKKLRYTKSKKYIYIDDSKYIVIK